VQFFLAHPVYLRLTDYNNFAITKSIGHQKVVLLFPRHLFSANVLPLETIKP